MSKLSPLPDYTKGEEIFNMVSHISGGGFGIIATAIAVICAIIKRDVWAITGCSIYGFTMILVYAISSIYHGLKPGTAKKVLRIIDHCAIYLLIAGTYTPILLCSIRPVSPIHCWILFIIVWGCAVLGLTLTAVDMKKYNLLSIICYLGMGWCIVFAWEIAFKSIELSGLIWLLSGGIAYTIGAVLYGMGRKIRYMHSIFHLFVVLGSMLQFICILLYII